MTDDRALRPCPGRAATPAPRSRSFLGKLRAKLPEQPRRGSRFHHTGQALLYPIERGEARGGAMDRRGDLLGSRHKMTVSMSAGSIASLEIASLNSPTVTIADTSSSLAHRMRTTSLSA